MSSSDGTCGLSATSRRPAATAAAGIASRTSTSAGAGVTVTCHGRPTRSERATPVTFGSAARAASTRGARSSPSSSWNWTSTIASSCMNRAASSWTVPCPMSRPAAKMPTRSHTDWTCESRWLDRRIVRPLSRLSDWSSSRISWTPIGSIAVVGSSRIRMSGSLTSASAIPSRWRMPREYVPTLSLPRSERPTWPRTSSIACSAALPLSPLRFAV